MIEVPNSSAGTIVNSENQVNSVNHVNSVNQVDSVNHVDSVTHVSSVNHVNSQVVVLEWSTASYSAVLPPSLLVYFMFYPGI